MSLNITDLKKGTIFLFDDSPYRVLEYRQKVMGRGGSIVNVRIKNLLDGSVLEKTFKGNEQLSDANLTYKPAQYLYNDGVNYFFMDETSYDQIELKEDLISEAKGFLTENSKVQLSYINNQVVGINLPKNIPLKVTYTENAVKGDTSTSIQKNATLESGLVIKVPAFIKQGDIVSVDTTNATYRERIR